LLCRWDSHQRVQELEKESNDFFVLLLSMLGVKLIGVGASTIASAGAVVGGQGKYGAFNLLVGMECVLP
ncbi:hypothetical protein IFM89_029349, partial [Coptis chinensis]